MKKIILLSISLFLAYISFAQAINYKVMGYADNLKPNEKVYLKKHIFLGWRNYSIIDSVVSKNGKFEFSGKVSEIVDAMVIGENKKFNAKFVLTDSLISIRYIKDSLSVIGDTETKVFLLEEEIYNSFREFSFLTSDSSSLYKTKNPYLARTYRKLFDSLRRGFLAQAMDSLFLSDKHRLTYANLWYNYSCYRNINPKKLQSNLNRLGARFQNHELTKRIRLYLKSDSLTHITKIENQVDTSGKTLNYIFPRPSYVLLDFWASWCGPCRDNNKELRNYYNKYKSKGFDIVAISIDESKERWRSAVKEDQVPWITVSDDKGLDNYMALITAIIYILPRYILLDPNGKIIFKTHVIKDLESKLKEVYAE